jgi:D-lactate dehydrogenase (cytochrome)
VVRADGDIVKTGAWAVTRNGKPFVRQPGPDVTGLFLGDNGTFGVKTAAALHIKRKAQHMAYASFAFESYEDLAATMIELSPYDFIARRTGLDPHESQTIAKVSFKDAVAAVAKVAGGESTLTGGMKAMAEMARSGLNFMDGVKWSMHLKVENNSERGAEDGMAIVRPICAKRGREFPAILPRAREAVGFSIRKFLGKDGERWVATSALFPIARAVEVARATEAFFQTHRADMARHSVINSYVTNYGPQYFLTEPCLFWPDSLTELHYRALPKDEAEKFRTLKGAAGVRDYVRALRFKLRDLLFDLGAVHVQIGEFYELSKAIDPSTWRLLGDLKAALDPNGILNPGKLDGLTARRQ